MASTSTSKDKENRPKVTNKVTFNITSEGWKPSPEGYLDSDVRSNDGKILNI